MQLRQLLLQLAGNLIPPFQAGAVFFVGFSKACLERRIIVYRVWIVGDDGGLYLDDIAGVVYGNVSPRYSRLPAGQPRCIRMGNNVFFGFNVSSVCGVTLCRR
jgi:hypothetical protein